MTVTLCPRRRKVRCHRHNKLHTTDVFIRFYGRARANGARLTDETNVLLNNLFIGAGGWFDFCFELRCARGARGGTRENDADET